MDSLIGLLVWVVIIGAAFHKNRKKRQEQQRRQPSVDQRTVWDSRSSQQEAKEESLWAELRQAIQDAIEEEKQQQPAKKEVKKRKTKKQGIGNQRKGKQETVLEKPTSIPVGQGQSPFVLEPESQANLSPIEKELLITTEGICLETESHRHSLPDVPTVPPVASTVIKQTKPQTVVQHENWAKAMALSVVLGDPVCKNRRRR